MEYKELRNILCAAAAEHKTIEAFVTFTQDSFPGTEYTLPERTYWFTSKEKAFSADKGGYSIFGNCMDGSDMGVRLELYMADEKGGKNGWKTENCGIVKYQLLAAYEREMCVIGYFNTLKEANRAMWEEMANAVNCTPEELYDFIQENEPAGECGFGALSAWANDAGPEDGNVDWKIVPIYMDGANIVIFEEDEEEN